MPPGVNAGDTAWMLVATALVLLMTPALGFFYAGLVRVEEHAEHDHDVRRRAGGRRDPWAVIGYSLAFDGDSGLIGGLGHAFLQRRRVRAARRARTIPHLLFMAFQGTFASSPRR